MTDLHRRNHYDVTDRVFVADPRVVCDSVRSILQPLYPTADLAPLRRSFALFGRLFAGALPGYNGCETPYHDVQHSLDCALAFTRLLDGYERSVPMRDRLGPRRGVVGVITALFHDAGYIRRDSDSVRHGAELTRVHVGRSGEFLAQQVLPQLGFAAEAPMVQQIVHYTGYELARDAIQVKSERDHRLGSLLGTADILAQMSDRCYLEKCRDFLYREFEMCGLAGSAAAGAPKPVYASPEDLLRRTGDFRAKLWADRMDGWFEGVYRCAEVHFSGTNPYLEAIESHISRLAAMPPAESLAAGLRRRAESVDAAALRSLLSRRPRRSEAERRWPQFSRRSRKPALPFCSAHNGVMTCA